MKEELQIKVEKIIWAGEVLFSTLTLVYKTSENIKIIISER